MIRAALALGAIAGTAWWVTLGCLDAFAGSDGSTTRMALLPSLTTLGVSIGGAATLCVGAIAWLSAAADRDSALAVEDAVDVLRPLGALGVLVLPYLPWLADALPVLTALAGPGRWLVWLVVLTQVVRLAWASIWRTDPDARLATRTMTRLLVGLFVTGFVASGVAAARFVSGPIVPGGDEPHYLIIAQSLWRDGDLKIENNHDRGDYLEYFGGTLDAHYLARGTDLEIYSVHPIGLPLVLAPVYALGGYMGVLILLVGASALGGVIAAAWMARLRVPLSAIVFAWTAIFLSAPFLIHTFTVYPESMAGVTTLLALFLLSSPRTEAETPGGRPDLSWRTRSRWIAVGAAAGWLPWLSTKYAPMAAVLVAVALGRLWLAPTLARPLRVRRILTSAVLAPFAVSLLAWFAFFQAYWGSPSPTGPYGGGQDTDPIRLLIGAPGLAFDQEYGVLPYAPVLMLAATGLLAMMRDRGPARRLACEIAALEVALIGTVGAFHLWWGGVSPGRPAVAGILLLTVPIGWQFARRGAHTVVSSVQHLLLAASLAMTGLLLTAQEGFLTVNYRDGSSTVLEYLSPLWNLSGILPSFIAQPPVMAYRTTAAWLAVAAGAAVAARWLDRRRTAAAPATAAGGGRATLEASVVVTAALVTVSLIVPNVIGAAAAHPTDLTGRSRLELLDRFDASALPLAITYDPWLVQSPDRLPPLMTLAISPDAAGRDDDLLYGRRFSLPPGRYRLGVSGLARAPTGAGHAVKLQVGRFLGGFATWDLDGIDPSTWSPIVDWAVEANYVGLKASPNLEAAGASFWIQPVSIVDRSARPDTPVLRGTAHFGHTAIYFFDRDPWIEATGFWLPGGMTTTFMAVRGRADAAASGRSASLFELRTHCGRSRNRLDIMAGDQSASAELSPGEGRSFQLMAADHRIAIEVTVRDSWEPAEHDPNSPDTRRLGCWIEIGDWLP